MAKNKGIIFLDPIEDKTILHIFNDLQNRSYTSMDLHIYPDEWHRASTKIGIKCKELIESKPPLLEPPVMSRTRRKGFVIKPFDVDVIIEPFGKKKKIIFNRKIF
jgi:hypothetical protein